MSKKLSEDLSCMRYKLKAWKDKCKDVKNITNLISIDLTDINLVEDTIQSLVDKIIDGTEL